MSQRWKSETMICPPGEARERYRERGWPFAETLDEALSGLFLLHTAVEGFEKNHGRRQLRLTVVVETVDE